MVRLSVSYKKSGLLVIANTVRQIAEAFESLAEASDEVIMQDDESGRLSATGDNDRTTITMEVRKVPGLEWLL